MPKPERSQKRLNTSVNLDADVLDYLKELGRRYRRSRSFLINVIIQDHARRAKGADKNAQQPTLP